VHSSTSPAQFAHFLSLACSMRSYQGTVSSRRVICLEASEISTMFGLSVAAAAFYENFSCFPRSTFSSQSCATASRPEEVAMAAGVGFFPALMKAMVIEEVAAMSCHRGSSTEIVRFFCMLFLYFLSEIQFWTLTLVYNKGSGILFTSILTGRQRSYEQATTTTTAATRLQGNKEGSTWETKWGSAQTEFRHTVHLCPASF